MVTRRPSIIINPFCCNRDSARDTTSRTERMRAAICWLVSASETSIPDKDGKLGDGRAFAFDMDHLLAPVNAFAERAQRPADDDVQPASFVSGDEQNFVARQAAFDSALSFQAARKLSAAQVKKTIE